MILGSLVSQLEQRFQHEKRAQVCLWFDEKQEFVRLLPPLQAYLSTRTPPPFVLLEYDPSGCQGQVWLKYRIHQISSQVSPEERRRLRFVLYMPLSEDRLDVPDGNDGVRLSLLEEYRAAGVIWRLGGKRPTLFSFLRQAGVALPESPAEQRRLYEGGPDSLLAKYVAKFVDRPALFWATQLTPELAQSRLIGDVDQTILDLAVDPDAAWATLQEKGLDREFRELVRERYGFDMPLATPAAWVPELVALLALTETYLGYGEPADFPFADRLPSLGLRLHHSQLLQRWLRDTEYRAAWDRWIQTVESRIDLSAWAKGRTGLSFGFPHLVRLRWQEILAAFEEAASKTSATAEFFGRHGERIAREAEFTKASLQPVGAWDLLRDLREFVAACEEGERKVVGATRTESLVRLYVERAGAIERRHIDLRHRAEEHGLPTAAGVADRAYASYANALNQAFFACAAQAGTLEVPGVPAVTPHLEQAVWKAKGRRAVVIVDALRYDCALAIKELLRGQTVDVEPMLAVIPTITPIGMTALLPLAGANVSLEVKGNNLHPRVNGKDMSVRENRLAFLKTFGADCRDIAEIESASSVPAGLGELLVVFGHEDVDHIGHGGKAESLIRHVQAEIERIARLVRKLHRWGYARVHVVTDHGFILLDESKLPSEVSCDKAWCHVLKERFALVPAGAAVPLVHFPFAWDEAVRVAVPPGLAFFKAEKSFSHGGAALQEVVIPHLVSRVQAHQKGVGIEVVLPTFELQMASVKVVLRPTSTAAATPGQMDFLAEGGRTVAVDVLRRGLDGKLSSVLAGKPKEVRLEPTDKEQPVTLFFHTATSFSQGELLDLDIRDVETTEQFPPGGIKLTVGRDL